jgi:hypothetical protein
VAVHDEHVVAHALVQRDLGEHVHAGVAELQEDHRHIGLRLLHEPAHGDLCCLLRSRATPSPRTRPWRSLLASSFSSYAAGKLSLRREGNGRAAFDRKFPQARSTSLGAWDGEEPITLPLLIRSWREGSLSDCE